MELPRNSALRNSWAALGGLRTLKNDFFYAADKTTDEHVLCSYSPRQPTFSTQEPGVKIAVIMRQVQEPPHTHTRDIKQLFRGPSRNQSLGEMF